MATLTARPHTLQRTLSLLLLAATPTLAWGQTQPPTSAAISAQKDLAACRVHQVTTLPGSHEFAGDFIEAIAPDPAIATRPHRSAHTTNTLYALTADLSSPVPYPDRAIYLSKSTTSGVAWTPIARIDSRYFRAEISEGLRNGLSVSPGAADFVVTTQQGAFQVIPQSTPAAAIIRPIPGPRVPAIRPDVTIPKHTGEPVRAGVIQMTADGKRLIIGFGYFDDEPQLITYHRGARNTPNNNPWIEDGPLPPLPTDLDIFSMLLDNPSRPRPSGLYVGTGDQAYHLDFRTKKWTQVSGVGPDSAIHCMSTVHGLHIAACWGVYEPVNALTVQRVTTANFLLHRAKDEVGPNIRAYGIEVDPTRPNRQVLTAITGVYISKDSGQTWRRLNDLPEGEFHTAHINPNGTVIVSGYVGTFLENPFSTTCTPHLKTRDQ